MNIIRVLFFVGIIGISPTAYADVPRCDEVRKVSLSVGAEAEQQRQLDSNKLQDDVRIWVCRAIHLNQVPVSVKYQPSMRALRVLEYRWFSPTRYEGDVPAFEFRVSLTILDVPRPPLWFLFK